MYVKCLVGTVVVFERSMIGMAQVVRYCYEAELEQTISASRRKFLEKIGHYIYYRVIVACQVHLFLLRYNFQVP